MNWNHAVKQTEANAYIPQNNNPSGGDSPFAKFDTGMHIIRPVGVGNYAEDIPFRHVMQHGIFSYANGKTNSAYCLCWDWMFSTESNRNNIIKPLMQVQQRMTQQDYHTWKELGCPFCKAANWLRQRKAEKNLIANMFPKNSYMWNIIIRGNQALGTEEKLQIWSPSQKNHQIIMETAANAYQDGKGIDIFNPATGFDWQLTAQGEKNLRRYALSLIPVPKAITIQHTPYDLNDVMLRNFKTYQETIDMMTAHYAEAFAQYGYRVPGDTTYSSVKQANPYAEGMRQSAVNNQLQVPRETPQPIAQFEQPKVTLPQPGKVVSGQPYVPESTNTISQSDMLIANNPPTKAKPVVDDEEDFWSTMTNSSPHNVPEGGEVKNGMLYVDGKQMF